MDSKVKKQLEDIVKRYRGDGYKYIGKWNGYKIYSILADRRITIGFTILGEKNGIVKVFKNHDVEKIAKEIVRE